MGSDEAAFSAIERELTSRGHDAVRSSDLDGARDRFRREVPPFVILDWNLPHGEALRLLREIRAHPDGEGIFVVALTDGRPQDSRGALELGADDFLARPLEPESLSAHLSVLERRALERRSSRRAQAELADAHDELDRQVRHFAEGRARPLGILEEQITERKRAELASLRYGAALECAGEGVTITDEHGNIEYVNAAFERLTGYTRDEVLGRNPRFLKSGRHDESFYRGLWATISSGGTWHREFVNRKKDGSLYDVEQTIAPIRDPEGRTVGFVGTQRDISERKRAEHLLRQMNEDLRRARDEVLEAGRIKSAFLANMSHELRTPLNAILGYAEILKESAEENGHSSYQADLVRIGRAGRALLDLIEDLLDISKLEAGSMTLETESFDVLPVADGVVADHMAAAERASTVLELVKPEQAVHVWADPSRVRQVLRNLVSNGVKFTDRGRVTVCVRKNGNARALVEVKDTGVGIHPEQLPRLFKPFTQVDVSSTRRHGGTGLGLAISKRLMDLMGGDLTVTSRPGEGSTFTMSLSLAAPAA